METRTQGLLSEAFRQKRIAVVGVGAGSYLVEKLARLKPLSLLLWDVDVVEQANLERTVFEEQDVGERKVDALARRLGNVNPFLDVEAHHEDLTKLSDEEARKRLRHVDLIVHGTDKFEVAAWVNEFSMRTKTPALFIGIHARAEGGRIVWMLPGVTGCYRCAAPERYAAYLESGREATDLDHEAGLIVDGQFIDMVALKILLALLERGQDSALGRFFEAMQGRNDVVVRCSPDETWSSSIWKALLGEQHEAVRDAGLFCMDTLWLATERDPHCPICGKGR